MRGAMAHEEAPRWGAKPRAASPAISTPTAPRVGSARLVRLAVGRDFASASLRASYGRSGGGAAPEHPPPTTPARKRRAADAQPPPALLAPSVHTPRPSTPQSPNPVPVTMRQPPRLVWANPMALGTRQRTAPRHPRAAAGALGHLLAPTAAAPPPSLLRHPQGRSPPGPHPPAKNPRGGGHRGRPPPPRRKKKAPPSPNPRRRHPAHRRRGHRGPARGGPRRPAHRRQLPRRARW